MPRATDGNVGDVEIDLVEPDTSAFRGVLALGKEAKPIVGFLPDAAFRARARLGRLIAVREGREVVAYVLFDLPRDEIKIVHLAVSESHRGRGYARALVPEIERRYPSRAGIVLSCRTDYAADRMWPRIGFSPQRDRAGRSIDGKPLTVWWKSFGHATLLSLIEEADARPIAALDSSTFFDLVAEPPKPVVEHLRSDWLLDHVQLAITDQVYLEMRRGTDAARKARQQGAARWFRRLSPIESRWKPFFDELHAAHPNPPADDDDDLHQIARALGGQATYLVTGDSKMQRRYGTTAKQLGDLQILSPDEFVREVDRLARGDWYRPVDLAQTSGSAREVTSDDLGELADRFVNHRAAESIRSLRERIASIAAQPRDHHLQVLEIEGNPRGLLCYMLQPATVTIELARVTSGRAEFVLGRFMLKLIRKIAVASGRSRIVITDDRLSSALLRDVRSEGFEKIDGGYIALSIGGRGCLADLLEEVGRIATNAEEREAFSSGLDGDERSAARAEARFSPFRVLGAGIPTFFVPIQHHWASDLFDVGIAEGQLFSRPSELGLRDELVYYRSARNGGGLRAPARILWYVSGKRDGARYVRAVSHLNEVVVLAPDQLAHRFERFGVYERHEIEGAAGKDGRAMALRFSNTELFRHPLPLALYQALSARIDGKDPVLRSPQPISEELFAEVHRRGTDAND